LHLVLDLVIHVILGNMLDVIFLVLVGDKLLISVFTQFDLLNLAEVFFIVGESHLVVIKFILEGVLKALVESVLKIFQVLEQEI